MFNLIPAKAPRRQPGAIESVGFQQVARMSEAKYGKTMMSSIVPVFRFSHTGYVPLALFLAF
ncbi:hypothetical protein CRH12_00135 [Coxiella burnetii]|nr:hypothetical protein [Coxiella burnetii]PHH58217.1 hypothetical protein CRH12_00135 [Coxiella burnetii]